MYIALTFSEETRSTLFRILHTFIDQNKYNEWLKFGDHITLIHETHPNFRLALSLLSNFNGHSVPFTPIAIGISENAIAFKVNVKTANEISHITMYTRRGYKPVESNYIKNWNLLYCDKGLYGVLEIVD